MDNIKKYSEIIIEEITKLEKKYNFSKEFKKTKNDSNTNKDPKDEKLEDNALLRKLKDIEDGKAPIKDLKELIKQHNKE